MGWLPAKSLILGVIFCLLIVNQGNAQDPQFSQFYAAPLYLNPAFTGSALQARLGINYRNQWPQISEANFETFAFYFDTYLNEYNSGVGLLVTRDQEGFAGLSSTAVSLSYAYQVSITNSITFRPGFQAGIVNKDLNFSDLTFGNQFDNTTGTFDRSIVGEPDLLATDDSFNFFDLGLGGLVYTDNWWIGVSAFHLTEPNQSFFDTDDAILPIRYSFHGGYKFFLGQQPYVNEYNRRREVSVTPTFQYKFQGDFDQVDLGVAFLYQPITAGLFYRGLPIKDLEGDGVNESVNNNESIVFAIGLLDIKGLNIGYSFDFTISELGISSGGAHEVSLSYVFQLTENRLPPKEKRFVPCPKI